MVKSIIFSCTLSCIIFSLRHRGTAAPQLGGKSRNSSSIPALKQFMGISPEPVFLFGVKLFINTCPMLQLQFLYI